MDTFVLGWLVLGALVLVWEILAVINTRRGDTLSEQVWKWIGLGQKGHGAPLVRRLLFAALWIAGTLHFFLGWS